MATTVGGHTTRHWRWQRRRRTILLIKRSMWPGIQAHIHIHLRMMVIVPTTRRTRRGNNRSMMGQDTFWRDGVTVLLSSPKCRRTTAHLRLWQLRVLLFGVCPLHPASMFHGHSSLFLLQLNNLLRCIVSDHSFLVSLPPNFRYMCTVILRFFVDGGPVSGDNFCEVLKRDLVHKMHTK